MMNLLLILVFIVLVIALAFGFDIDGRFLISQISPTALVILAAATFRLTRLFVYDNILHDFRAFFDRHAAARTDRFSKLFFRSIAALLDCPWCTGMWMALLTFFLYAASGVTALLVFILALAGAARFIQISINAIGWRAEKEKREVQENNKT